ncbi:MBL fold metallo-hydrolase [Pseudonocardia sp. NPDC049154]|uniref:MBL fold metallo-hydrolase n=1 Tax=Pseudonocardia sp. NPDC049154 TaxID=3155501 RepID=UPI0033C2E48B
MNLRIGSATVTTVRERDLPELAVVVPEARPEALAAIDWLQPHYVDETGNPRGVVQAFVIECEGTVIVVDSCIGDDKDITVVEEWAHSKTGFLERFHAAGFDPERVDVVLSTHLHLDHVGWNTTWTGGAWVPTFPHARHYVARAELEHWRQVRDTPAAEPGTDADELEHLLSLFRGTQACVYEQSVQPVIDAGLVELVDPPTEVASGVTLVPTPGHTPGHISIRVRSDGEELFISGDAFHHPSQIANPTWSAVSDDDPVEGVATRRRLLRELADSPTIVLGTHFAAPSHGRIVTDAAGGHRFESGTVRP